MNSLALRKRLSTAPICVVLVIAAGQNGESFADAPPRAVAPFDAMAARAHQTAWADHLGTTVETTNATGVKLVLIPPGEFLMGSTPAQIREALAKATEFRIGADRQHIPNEGPQHRVVLTKPFRLSATEITVGQFRRFIESADYTTETERLGGGNTHRRTAPTEYVYDPALSYAAPGYPVTDESPATQITWNDAVASVTGSDGRNAPSIGCRPKPNGNTPAALGRRPTIPLATTPANWATTPGMARTASDAPARSASSGPTHLACSTCTAIPASGAPTGTARSGTPAAPRKTHSAPPTAPAACCAAASGSIRSRTCEARIALNTGPPQVGTPLYFSWDDHANAQPGWDMAKGMRWRAEFMDPALSTLIDDVYARGLDQKILVVAVGEFGRTPRLTSANGCLGRDHWPQAQSALLAGGGLKMGQVIGATTSKAEYPIERPLEPQDLLATIYRHLGVDPNVEFSDFAGRPHRILHHGEPIRELV